MVVEEKPLLRLAAPVVVSFWMRAAFSLVDTAYASTLGDAAVAAIGLTVPLEFLFIACWVGVSTGLTSNLSRAMGAHRGEEIAQLLALTRRVILVLCGSFLLLGAGVWLAAPRLGLAADVARQFRIYATVTVVGSAATAFWSVIPDSLVKAHHDTAATMWAGIWSNVINLALNTLFLFVFHWGIFGIALSTVIGRLGGLAYALRKASEHERRRISAGDDDVPGLAPRPLTSLLSLAVPAAMAYGLMALEGSALNTLLALLPQATAGIAAYAVFHRAFLFLLMPLVATTIALLPFVARHHGAGRDALVRHGLRQAYLAGAAYILLFVTPLVLLAGDGIARMLSESPTTIALIAASLKLCPLMIALSMPFVLNRPVFEGLGTGRPVAVLAGLRYLVLTLPFCYGGLALARQLGYAPLQGLLVGLMLATGLVSCVAWVWLRRLMALRMVSSSACAT